ncbi:MAG: hypothetical protein R3264_07910 [Anaerolineae bacterium]|nr:hypothetical protein [Anaerolineae bacterium]
MTNLNQYPQQQKSSGWQTLLESISDSDLDLLISANSKMARRETILSPQEMEAYLRWHAQFDRISNQ